MKNNSIYKIQKLLFIFLQCTWGILPTVLGAVFYIKLRHYPHRYYRGCIDTQWDTRSGLSLGLFIFTPKDTIQDSEKIRVHEYGHCILSMVLGPLFLPFGLISVLWGRLPYYEKRRTEKHLPYTSCFVEAWASKWGEMVTGESAIWD